MMALEDVNNRMDLLPGYKLKLHWNDSEVWLCLLINISLPDSVTYIILTIYTVRTRSWSFGDVRLALQTTPKTDATCWLFYSLHYSR